MWQITVMNWVFKIFKYLKEKVNKTKPEEMMYSKGEVVFRDNKILMANENIPVGTPFKEGDEGATWSVMTSTDNINWSPSKVPVDTSFKDNDTGTTWIRVDSKTDSSVITEPKKDESYPGFDATGKMIFDDEPKANKKYWVDRDLESTKHLMRMQKMVAKSIRDDQSLLNTLKTEIQKLYLLCEPDVNTIPMQMTFMALNTLRDEQRVVKKRLANNASTAYWLKQQLK
jgi:hypothetical protein